VIDLDKPTDAEPKGNILTLGSPKLDEYVCTSGSQPYLDYEEIKAAPVSPRIKEPTGDVDGTYQYIGIGTGGPIAGSDEGGPTPKKEGINMFEDSPPANAGYGTSIRVHVLCPPANGADRSGASAKPALTGALST
jgi:hypothetical protein